MLDSCTAPRRVQRARDATMACSPLVSAAWLSARLAAASVKGGAGGAISNVNVRDIESAVRVLDASWYLPTMKRNGREEYEERRIPTAAFFDIDETDDQSGLPHMLPSEKFFSSTMDRLGIRPCDHVVCYDGHGIFSAPRAWWLLRAFGHEKVSVLDGGLPAWLADGHTIETGEPTSFPANAASDSYAAKLQSELVCTLNQMRANIVTGRAQVVDARSAGRFAGTEPEPRAGLRSGHIPGSRSLPFGKVLNEGRMLPADQLRSAFESAGVDLGGRPLLLSCGSGVTASTLALGLAALGKSDVAVYDGSWSEWGQSTLDTPVETGPQV